MLGLFYLAVVLAGIAVGIWLVTFLYFVATEVFDMLAEYRAQPHATESHS